MGGMGAREEGRLRMSDHYLLFLAIGMIIGILVNEAVTR